MVEKNKTETVDEPTIKFADDGIEYKINEMPESAKELMARWQEKKQIRDEFVVKANNDIDDDLDEDRSDMAAVMGFSGFGNGAKQ